MGASLIDLGVGGQIGDRVSLPTSRNFAQG